MNYEKAFRVKPGSKVKLKDSDARTKGPYDDKDDAKADLKENVEKLKQLQRVLYAEDKHSLLIVLQAMDAGGKDGTIRHVMGGLNPQGCRVASFKAPTAKELSHDFLWRIHRHTPGRGEIGIFNRSHYEDVLIVRVHDLVSKSVWSERYGHINAFEKLLADSGTTILKFFLHISKDEQKERFQDRIDEPDKNWKVNPADFEERRYWTDYMKAFEDALEKTSTDYAPWYVIPADRKWFRNLAVSSIIVKAMEDMKMEFPKPEFDVSTLVVGD